MGHGASIIPPPLNKYIVAVFFAFWYKLVGGGRIGDLEDFGNGGAVWQRQRWAAGRRGFPGVAFHQQFHL